MGNSPHHVQPFVKWAGGKSQLLGELSKYFPKKFNRYFEPFLGGGAVYFYLRPASAILSDANFELINAYKIVANKASQLIKELETSYQSKELTEEFYYHIRDEIDADSLTDVERAARFIFLNKTCYNGLYRVNKDGRFNVPIGKYDKMPTLYDSANLKAVSALLKTAKIRPDYYPPVLREFRAGKGDFVYLDPPYAVENGNGFISYTKEVFTWSEQEKLAKEFATLAESGCHVMVSNANEEAINQLYKDVAKEIIPVKVGRMINSVGSQRTGYSELIITSYVPEVRTLKAWMKE
jgi:DNA adenine methylase